MVIMTIGYILALGLVILVFVTKGNKKEDRYAKDKKELKLEISKAQEKMDELKLEFEETVQKIQTPQLPEVFDVITRYLKGEVDLDGQERLPK